MARALLQSVSRAVTVEDSSSGSHSSGSIGMLFVVLVVIIVLGLLAGFLARVCGGRHFGGSMEYDFEGWVERTCASCIDGSIPSSGGGEQVAPKANGDAGGGGAAKPSDGVKGDEPKSTDGGGEKKGGGNGGEKKGGDGDEKKGGDEKKKDGEKAKENGEISGS